MAIELRRFQKRFLRAALSDRIDTAALSLPRGNGKSSLAGHLVTRILTPGDPLFRAGTESVIGAASLEQGRIVFRFARTDLEPTGAFNFRDSLTRIGITHKPTNTRIRVLGSNGKTAMGLVHTPWAILDEPGAWEVRGGQLLHDAIQTAQGKPGSPLKALYIGTLAPSESGWWHDMIEAGTGASTYVMALRGDPKRWHEWPEIRRCNPLSNIDARFRRKLVEERDAARADTRLKARFLSLPPQHSHRRRIRRAADGGRLAAGPGPRGSRPGRPTYRRHRPGAESFMVRGRGAVGDPGGWMRSPSRRGSRTWARKRSATKFRAAPTASWSTKGRYSSRPASGCRRRPCS